MRHSILVAAAAMTLLACAPREPQVYYGGSPAAVASSGAPHGTPVGGTPLHGYTPGPTYLKVSNQAGYVIDPISRSCTLVFLLYASSVPNTVSSLVDCATVAANFRDAQAFITWLRPAAPPAAPAQP